MTDISKLDIDNLTYAEFEEHIPDFFAAYEGHVSTNPRFAKFLAANPDCAALFRDFEEIASAAKALFDRTEEPSDSVWDKIRKGMNTPAIDTPAIDTPEASPASRTI